MVDVYGNLNLKQNQPTYMVVHKGTAFPTSPTPVAGQLFYRSDDEKLYFYNGTTTTWTEVGAGGGGGGIGRFIETFTSQTSVTVTHNLGDANPVVQVYNGSAEQMTPDAITVNDGNSVTVTFTSSTSGFIVVHGGQGVDIGTTAYYSVSFSGQTTVNVGHGLGQKYVQVQCYDNSDILIEPTSVTLTDANNLVVTFGLATTGYVVVAGGSTSVDVFGIKRYSESFTSETTGYVVLHNLNTLTPSVTVYNDSGELIFPDVTITNNNSVTIDFATSTSGDVEVQGGLQSTSPGSGSADFIPNTNNAYDLGSGTFKWKDGYFAGKLTVDGGIDPLYIQLTPVASSAGVPNNSLWIDDTNFTLNLKDNTGGTGQIGVSQSDVDALSLENAEQQIEIIELQANAGLPPFDHDTLVTDTFSDSTGYINTVNTGSTTAQFNTNNYRNTTVDQNSPLYSQNASVSNPIMSGYCTCEGYISQVILRTGSSTNKTCTIRNQAGTIIAQKTQASTTTIFNFVPADYSQLLNNETWTVQLTLTSIYVKTDFPGYDSPFGTWGIDPGVYISSADTNNGTTFTAYPTNLYVVIDLPSIAGTVTDFAILSNGTGIPTYDITDGATSQTGLTADGTKVVSTLAGVPTSITFYMDTAQTTFKTYCLKLWKA